MIIVGSSAQNTWSGKNRPRKINSEGCFVTEDTGKNCVSTNKIERTRSVCIESSKIIEKPKNNPNPLMNARLRFLTEYIKYNEKILQNPNILKASTKTIVVDARNIKPNAKIGIEKVIVTRYEKRNVKRKMLLQKRRSSMDDWKKRMEFWSEKFAELRIQQAMENVIKKKKSVFI